MPQVQRLRQRVLLQSCDILWNWLLLFLKTLRTTTVPWSPRMILFCHCVTVFQARHYTIFSLRAFVSGATILRRYA